ncbi:hypothetical protein F1188_05285 [Roseospira marina]|uniref:Uncharacterized protein n=1 Tax=Roseospira marina TaxID=140057 RepID=A0A5M6IEP4_9PROT|nr:hypothetical protein [Roseospira marina]KAA5606743.1 hypothetical protein F1188_05285 [Roseospira marina]MBB4313837.1 hypothetical protein [Roseospira marina]MBB5086999.1 hypothetical protein [Roseospira marina]
MSHTPTSYHAFNLFTLTMESRYGARWRNSVEPETVAVMADEIALGFGGIAETPTSTVTGGSAPTVWRLPDESRVRTGRFGLKMELEDEGHLAAG